MAQRRIFSAYSLGVVAFLGGLAVLLAPLSSAGADPGNAKAMRYHQALAKRPDPGYLYDRFYNAWLDTGTIESLEVFLQDQVAQNKSTSDRLLLAFFYAMQGDDVRALKQFQTALEQEPGNAHIRYLKGTVEARTLDFEHAIEDLLAAGRSNPAEKLTRDIAKLLGKLYVRNREIPKALSVWNGLLAANPEDEELCEDIIELQIREGVFEEASALSLKLIEQTKDEYDKVVRRMRLGDIYQRAGQRDKASEVYGATLEQVGQGTWLEREILAQIEQLYRREDDLAGLKTRYETILKQYPKRIQIRKQFARLLANLGEGEAARKQFEQILKLTPGDRDNLEAYVSLLAGEKKVNEACEVLRALITQYPKDGELQIRLAKLLSQAKDTKGATQAVDQYVSISDKSQYVYLRAARTLHQLELDAQAEQMYQRLTAAHPDSNTAHEAHAAFLFDRKKKPEALAIWRKLAEGADCAQTVHLARVLAARHEHSAALDLLKPRYADFSSDPAFLSQLVIVALATGKFEEAVPWVRRRVVMAHGSRDLEAAIIQAARVLEKTDKTTSVVQSLENAPQRSVQDSCLLAELLEQLGDRRRADETLNALTATDLSDSNQQLARNQQIRLYTQRQDFAQASEALRQLIELPKGRTTGNVKRLVEMYRRQNRLEEATQWVQQWKALAPSSSMPWVAESNLLLQHDKTKEALGVLQAAARQFEGDKDLQRRLATLFMESGRLRDAARIYWRQYEDANDLNTKIRSVQQLAEIAEREGQTEELVRKFEQRRQTNRESIEPLLALAEIQRVSGNYEARRKALLKAARMRPDDIALLHQIARIEEDEGDWRRALATLEGAAKLDTSSRTRSIIARLYLNNGEEDKGYAVLFELAGGKDANVRDIESIASTLIGVKAWDRAIEFLAPKVAQSPDDYRLRYLYAVAFEEAAFEGETVTANAVEQFLTLLSAEKELPGRSTSQAPQSPWSQYLGAMGSMMPQAAVELMEISWMQELLYSYRRNSGGFSMASFGATQRGAVLMPIDVKSAQRYAVIHLLKIATSMDEQDRTNLVTALRQHGIADAELLLEMPSVLSGRPDFGPLIEKFKNNQAVMALYVLMAMNGPGGADFEQLSNAFELFKDDWPQLAVTAAILAAASDEEQTSLLDEAMRILPEIKQPSALLLMSIAQASGAGMGMGSNQPTAIPESYRKKLADQMIDWYPKVNNLGPQRDFLFFSIVSFLATSDDPAPFFSLLDDEIVRWRSRGPGSQANAMMGMFGGMRNPNQLIRPPTFPPDQFADFPSHVQSLLSADETSSQMTGVGMTEWDEQTIEKCLTAIKDPTLKILIAQKYEQKPVVEKTLDEMLQAKPPQLDALLLAAGKAVDDQHEEAASQLLDKSRYLPMSKQTRQRIDSALVALALAAQEKEQDTADKSTGGSPLAGGLAKALAALNALAGKKQATEQSVSVIEAGRQAALRLRRAHLRPEQRQELVAALEELDLKKEAERLDKAPATMSGPSRGMASRSSMGQQTDRIAKLFDEGKPDKAINIVVGNLRTLTQNALTTRGINRYETRRTRQTIEQYGMTSDVLAKLEPGDSPSWRSLAQFGMACEILGERDKAESAYEQALAKRPKEDSIRIRLALLVAEHDIQATGAHLRKINWKTGQQLGQQFVALIQDDSIGTRKKIELIEAVDGLLAELKETDRVDLTWVSTLAKFLAGGMSTRRSSLPSLFIITSNPEELSKHQADLDKYRRQVFDKLCRTMLTVPQLAPTGFTLLLAAAEGDDKVTDEFVPMAIKALLTFKPNQRSSSFGSSYSYSSSSGGNKSVSMRPPEEFLVRHAWKTKNIALISEKVLPDLKNANKAQQIRSIESQLKLYTCPDNEFAEQAAEFLKKRRGRTPLPAAMANTPLLAKIIEVWSDRQLQADIEPMILDVVKKNVRGSNYWGIAPVISLYAVELAKKGDRTKVTAFLERLLEACLGPPKKREALIAKTKNRRNMGGGMNAGPVDGFLELASQLLSHRELTFPMLDLLETHDLLLSQRNSYGVYSEINTGHGNTDGNVDDSVNNMLKYLEASPFLEDLDGFHVYPLEASSEGTVLNMVLYLLAGNDSDLREQLRGQLELRDPKTFGTGLVVAALADGSTLKNRVLEYLATHETELKDLPIAKQLEFASLVSGRYWNRSVSSDELSDDAQRIAQWLADLTKGSRDERIKRVLEAKRIGDLNNGASHEMVQDNAKLLHDLISSDPVRAKQFFLKLADLWKKASKSRTGSSQFNSGDNAANLLRLALDPAADLTGTAFGIDMVLDRSQVKAECDNRLGQLLGRPVTVAYKRIWSKIPKEDPERDLKALKALYGELSEKLSPRPTTILAASYFSAVRTLSPDELDQAAEWLDGLGDVELAHEWSAAVEVARAHKLDRKNKAESTQPNESPEPRPINKYHEYYLSVIHDAQLPVSWRFAVVATVLQVDRKTVPPSVVLAGAELLTEAWESKSDPDPRQSLQLLKALLALPHDESWKATAGTVVAKWSERLASQKRSGARSYSRSMGGGVYYSSSSSSSDGDTDLPTVLLKLSLILENDQAIDRLMQHQGQTLCQRPSALAALVRHGQTAHAVKLVHTHWRQIQSPGQQWETHQYDQELHTALPAFLEAIPTAGQRYFAEVLLGMMGDATEGNRNPGVDYETRVKEIAERFSGVTFVNPMLREKTLQFLSQNKLVAPFVVQPLAELVVRIDDITGRRMQSPFGDSDGDSERDQKIVGCYVRTAFACGRVDDVVETVKRISSTHADDPEYRKETIAAFVEIARRVVSESLADWSPEQLAAVLPTLRRWSVEVEPTNYRLRNLLSGLVVSHVLANQKDELLAWWEELPSEQRTGLTSNGSAFSYGVFWTSYVRAVGKPNQGNLARRIEIVTRTLQIAEQLELPVGHDTGGTSDPSESPFKTRSGGSIRGIVLCGLLTAEELLEHGPAIAESVPINGRMWACVANAQSRDKQFELAASSWDKAIQLVPEDDKSCQANWRLNQSRQLSAAGNSEKARQVLESLDRNNLNKPSQKAFDKLLKELQSQ